MPPRGPKVFGWDAVFEPSGYDMTCDFVPLLRTISIDFCGRYAEMPSQEKNKISHRGKALEKLKIYLQSRMS